MDAAKKHTTQIKSGRMRGLWLAQCSCGWESTGHASYVGAGQAAVDHEEEANHSTTKGA